MWIVGIDIAKHNHEASVLDDSGNPVGAPFSFTNTDAGVEKLLNQINKRNKTSVQIEFGMEVTGHYWIALHSHLTAAGLTVHVLNPIQTDSFRKGRIRQTKTDAIDSVVIAEIIRFGHYKESALLNPNMMARRELCRYRFSLVDNTSDLKRRVIAMMDQVFPEYEALFSNMFGSSSKAILEQLTSPEEILELDVSQLSTLLEHESKGRLSMDKAVQLQYEASHSIGIHLGVDALVFAIRQNVEHIRFLEQQILSLDDQISNTLSRFSSPIITIPGIGKVLGACILGEIGDIEAFADTRSSLLLLG